MNILLPNENKNTQLNHKFRLLTVSFLLLGILSGTSVYSKDRRTKEREIYHKIHTEHRKPRLSEDKILFPFAYPDREKSPRKHKSKKPEIIKYNPDTFFGDNDLTNKSTNGVNAGNIDKPNRLNTGKTDNGNTNNSNPEHSGFGDGSGFNDSDGDGIIDSADKCPNEPGLKKFKGCPDSDGDGVPDFKDLCPDTPLGIKVDGYGCPIDSDGDGYVDDVDQCPDEYGPLEYLGCPTLEKIDSIITQDSIIAQDTIIPIIEEDRSIPRGKDIKFNHIVSGNSCKVTASANFPGEIIKYMILLEDKKKICFFKNGGSATFYIDPDKEYHLQVVPYVESRGKKQRVSDRIIINKGE